jgi:hypothetical protein
MRTLLGYLALGPALVTIATVAAADEYADCRAIADAEERLACYDELASPPAAEPEPAAVAEPEPSAAEPPQPADPPAAKVTEAPAPSQPPAATPPPSEPAAATAGEAVLTDEVGRENLKHGQQEERELAVRGRLERCEKLRSGKYVFYFDNGQIWKQADSKRLSWKECNFEVTIGKDFFGYQMSRDDDDRSVRISRVR